MLRRTLRLGLIAAALTIAAGACPAAAVFSFSEVGADVIGVLSGSLDTTGMNFLPSTVSGVGIRPSDATLFSGPGGQGSLSWPDGLSPAPAFGVGASFISATSSSGDIFVIFQDHLALPANYIAGTLLTGSLTFGNHSFASLGITPGAYVYGLPNDTVTLRFGVAAAVPEPATLGIAGLALAALVLTRRTR